LVAQSLRFGRSRTSPARDPGTKPMPTPDHEHGGSQEGKGLHRGGCGLGSSRRTPSQWKLPLGSDEASNEVAADDRSRAAVRTLSGHRYRDAMSQPAAQHDRRHRLEVRVTTEQDALIREAADLEATTVTAFVLDTVTARAKRVIKQHHDLVLSNEAFDRFIAELDKPAEDVPELVRLFRRNPKLPET